MATRVIITTENGTPLYGLDGHHGATHAARWVSQTMEHLAAQGIADPVVLELFPEEGGDACRDGIIANLSELQLETRRTPDNQREIIALNRLTQVSDGITPRQAVATTPHRVRATLRMLHAPPEYAGQRHKMRIPRGRLEPAEGSQATPQAARLQRKLARRSRK